jgi:hypothetical protein
MAERLLRMQEVNYARHVFLTAVNMITIFWDVIAGSPGDCNQCSRSWKWDTISYKTSVTIYQTTQLHIPKGSDHHTIKLFVVQSKTEKHEKYKFP